MDASDSPKPSSLYTSNTSMLMQLVQPTLWQNEPSPHMQQLQHERKSQQAHVVLEIIRKSSVHWKQMVSDSKCNTFTLFASACHLNNEQWSGFRLGQTMLDALNHSSSRSFSFYINVSSCSPSAGLMSLACKEHSSPEEAIHQTSGDSDSDRPRIGILLHIVMLCAVASAFFVHGNTCNNG